MKPIHAILPFVLALGLPSGARAVPCTQVDYAIDCGETVTLVMPSLNQVMEDYGVASNYDAGEYVVEFVVPIGWTEVKFIHPSTLNHAIFMMGPGTCDSSMTGWWDDTGVGVITSGLTGGQTYYLSVDAQLPVPWNSYVDLSMKCNNIPYEGCGIPGDEDGDGLENCDDPDCQFYINCLPTENCNNLVDDNNDGLADCNDPLCFSYPYCHPEDCYDGVDNNNDGLVDCDDSYCIGIGACPETDCNNGIDDDLDSLVDCQDPDCPPCPPEDCSNNVDDDLDGHTDCQDPDCSCEPPCWGGEDCADGVDDDGDGFVDCADCECYLQAPCLGEAGHCTDGLDNDLDGFFDCDDPECENDPNCFGVEWHCYNYIDDDFDGLTDCADPDCATHWYCTGVCEIVEDLGCGDSFTWTSEALGLTDFFVNYEECGVYDEQNSENEFGLPTATEADQLVVTATALTGAIDGLYIVEETGGGTCVWDLPCVDHAAPGTPLTFTPQPGSAYYAVVESNAYQAEFQIDVQCLTQQPEDCADPGDQDGDGLADCDDPDCNGYDFPDLDGDGYDICDDCWDGDASVYPGAPEIPCDGIDQDCDGADAGGLDEDGDGYESDACVDGDDCDDSNAAIHPGAAEDCYDGVDNDCDGDVDMDDDECAPQDDDTSDDDDTGDDDTGDDDEGDDDGDDDIGDPPCEGCCCQDCSLQRSRSRAGLSVTLIAALLGLLVRRRRISGRSER